MTVVNDNEKDSSNGDSITNLAAGCIRFSILGKDFGHPIYTHQIFPNEIIPGYKPMMMKMKENVVITNFGNNNTTTTSSSNQSIVIPTIMTHHELSICIDLSPSCRYCSVKINIKRAIITNDNNKKRELLPQTISPTNDTNNNKKVKIQENESSSLIELGNKDSNETNDEDEGIVAAPADPTSTTTKRMTEEELRIHMQKYLPPIIKIDEPSTNKNGIINDDFLTRPIGSIVKEYTRNGTDFCLCLCNGEECVKYHNAVQKLAMYFIETADDVDVSDESGSWKVLYLFHKHINNSNDNDDNVVKYSFAGYVTLYHFSSPFRKPIGGTIIRICQALILPPYQRSGHGKIMLHTIFEQCCMNDDNNVVEINCEDPAPGFSTLRILVDWERYINSNKQWFNDETIVTDVSDKAFFTPINESKALNVTIHSKTTVKQIQMVYELDRLQQLQNYFNDNNNKNNNNNNNNNIDCEVLEKRFRLMVKQRLNKLHKEELMSLPNKSAMQTRLSELYNSLETIYKAILRAVTIK